MGVWVCESAGRYAIRSGGYARHAEGRWRCLAVRCTSARVVWAWCCRCHAPVCGRCWCWRWRQHVLVCACWQTPMRMLLALLCITGCVEHRLTQHAACCHVLQAAWSTRYPTLPIQNSHGPKPRPVPPPPHRRHHHLLSLRGMLVLVLVLLLLRHASAIASARLAFRVRHAKPHWQSRMPGPPHAG